MQRNLEPDLAVFLFTVDQELILVNSTLDLLYSIYEQTGILQLKIPDKKLRRGFFR